MNLLVVEDNPRDMQELLNLLHGWEEQNQPLGIRAESCITADTMQAFQGYDAVLLDIETPGIDGMAFARRLRACNSRIDIIFVTCHTIWSWMASRSTRRAFCPSRWSKSSCGRQWTSWQSAPSAAGRTPA